MLLDSEAVAFCWGHPAKSSVGELIVQAPVGCHSKEETPPWVTSVFCYARLATQFLPQK